MIFMVDMARGPDPGVQKDRPSGKSVRISVNPILLQR